MWPNSASFGVTRSESERCPAWRREEWPTFSPSSDGPEKSGPGGRASSCCRAHLMRRTLTINVHDRECECACYINRAGTYKADAVSGQGQGLDLFFSRIPESLFSSPVFVCRPFSHSGCASFGRRERARARAAGFELPGKNGPAGARSKSAAAPSTEWA